MKNNNVTEKDLFYILDLFEHMKVTYWLDGGWGVEVPQSRSKRLIGRSIKYAKRAIHYGLLLISVIL